MFRLGLFCLLSASSWTLTLTSSVNEKNRFSQPAIQLNGTEFVDNVMEDVRKRVIEAGLDEINPPDVSIVIFNQSLSVNNQSIVGMANAYRVGDVIVTATFFHTKFRSAFAVYNVSSDADVQIHTRKINYDEGHIHSDCDNITAYQVFKLSHWTQTITLDEFELTVGECVNNVTGLGELALNGSQTATKLFKTVKEPVLKMFSFAFKSLINAALQAARLALIG